MQTRSDCNCKLTFDWYCRWSYNSIVQRILHGLLDDLNLALYQDPGKTRCNLLHHSWFPQTCVASNICILFPPLKESPHKISFCHLYKHSREGGPDGSHQKTVQLDDKFVSDIPVIIFPGILQGILEHHFVSGYPRKTIKNDQINHMPLR